MKTSNRNYRNWSFHSLNTTFLFIVSCWLACPALAQDLNTDGDEHTITFSGSYEDFIIPADISTNLILFYLEGGDGGGRNSCNGMAKGGKGAEITVAFPIGDGDDELQPGGTIRFIAGGKGVNQNSAEGGGAGGGGGTAILYLKPGAMLSEEVFLPELDLENSADNAWILLAVAGGGGGAYGEDQNDVIINDACDESTAKNGTGGSTGTTGRGGGGNNAGGTNGTGGESGDSSGFDGGGGGGYLGNGQPNIGVTARKGGLQGGAGATTTCSGCSKGGFGYGGGGFGDSTGGGGGGGGFSGGGGGNSGSAAANNGGGGGSFVNDAAIPDLTLITGGGNTGNPKNGFITYSFPQLELTTDINQIPFTGAPYDIIIPSDLDLDQFDAISFTLRGADGGRVKTVETNPKSFKGGEGALVTASFKIGTLFQELQPGGTLRLIVGEPGDNKSKDNKIGAGGGGGTAILYRPPGVDGTGDCTISNNGETQAVPSLNVSDDCWIILAVAGGGGGARHNGGVESGETVTGQKGLNANTGINGTTSGGGDDGAAGVGGGSGGPGTNDNGNGIVTGGGGGYLPLFPVGTEAEAYQGAPGAFTGGRGGTAQGSFNRGGWGYGGGGSGRGKDGDTSHGGGGGGGFSGGGGGRRDPGGGGGSFVNQAALTSSIEADEDSDAPISGFISYNLFKRPQTGPIASCKSLVTVNITGSEDYDLFAEDVDQGSYVPDDSNAALDFSICFTTSDGMLFCVPKVSFSCGSIGTTGEYLLQVSDGEEESFCTFNYEVFQGNIGTLTCPDAQEVDLVGDDCEAILSHSDNFGATEINLAPSQLATCADSLSYYIIRPDNSIDTNHIADMVVGDIDEIGIQSDTFGVGTSTVVYTTFYTDPVGDQVIQNCSFTVTVNDPVMAISCPDNITVEVPEEDFFSNACMYFLEHSSEDELELDFDAPCSDISYRITDSAYDPIITEGTGLLSAFNFFAGTNTVEYFVNRPGGNVLTCSFTVDISSEGSIGVNLNCPADQTLSLGTSMDQQEIIDQIDFTTSSLCSIIDVQLEDFDLSCTQVGQAQNNVQLLVTSASGDVESCLIDITISDDRGVTCPDDFAVDLDAGSCTATIAAELLAPVTTYLCSSQLDFSIVDENLMLVASGSESVTEQILAEGAYTISYDALSVEGLMSSCSFTITINEDEEPPIAICTDIAIGLSETISSIAEVLGAASTDNCGITSYSISPSLDLTCTNLGIHSVVLTTTDAVGNQGICLGTVQILDDTPPTIISCPPDQAIFSDSEFCEWIIPDLTDQLVAEDDCGNVFINQIGVDGPTDVLGAPLVVAMEVEDEAGNRAVNTCLVTVTLADNTAPVANCQDYTVELNANGQASLSMETLGSASWDNCGITSYQTTFEDCSSGPCLDVITSNLPLNCDNIGINAVNLTVKDASGNMSTCSANVTVEDLLPPTAVCQDRTIQLNTNGTASITTGDIDNGSDDACGSVSLELSTNSFSCADAGSNTVSLTVTDDNNNSTSCTATVTVEDSTPPNVICSDVTVQLNASGNASITVDNVGSTSTDNCGIVSESLSQMNFDCRDLVISPFDPTPIVTYTATDANGNSSYCTATVTVEDNIPPTVLCKDMTVNLNNNGVGNLSTLGGLDNGSTDNCEITNSVWSLLSFDCADVGTVTVTQTFWDANGNSANCTQSVLVQDLIPPNANCSDLTLQLDASGNGIVLATDIDNGSDDNCDLQPLSINQSNFDCTFVGAQNVTLTVTDQSNNSSTCSAIITVEDNVAPTASCQNTTVQLNSAGFGTISTADINNGSSDACGIATMNLTETQFNCTDVGPNTVMLIVEDVNDVASFCSATVMVEDNIAPTAICQGTTVQLDAGGTASINTTVIDNGSNDACNIQSLSLDKANFSCAAVGVQTVILTVTDMNNNSSTCSASVIVEDDTAPIAMCQNTIVKLDGNGNGFISTTDIDNGSNDACGTPSLSLSQAAFDCSMLGDQTITLTADDGNDNTSTCTAIVSVEDNIPPEIDCIDDYTVNPDPGNCETTVNLTLPLCSDNCTVTVLRHRRRPVDAEGNNISGEGWSGWTTSNNTSVVLEVGFWKIQWQAKDASNNQRKCAFIISVTDNEAPTAACLHPIIEINGENEVTLTADQVWNEMASFDNCGSPVLVDFFPASVSCDQLGMVVPVNVTIVDASNNPASCVANVLVEGVPCGWNADPNGINCANSNNVGYDPGTGTFTVTSNGCYDPNFYSNSDSHGSVGTELCNDGEIIAHVTQVIGNGWAGITMREDLSAGANMIQLSIDGYFLTKRELRLSTGGLAYNSLFQTQGKHWLRLTRTGNVFTSFHSTDGLAWEVVFTTNISMADCIHVGLITENATPTGNVTGIFGPVMINNTTAPLTAPPGNDLVETVQASLPTVDVYPNPAQSETTVELAGFEGQDVQLSLRHISGELMQLIRFTEVHQSIEILNLQGMPSGVYLIEVKSGYSRIGKRLVISK